MAIQIWCQKFLKQTMEKNKKLVHDFWNDASCGEELFLKGTKQDFTL